MAGEVNRRVSQAPRIRSNLSPQSGTRRRGPGIHVIAPVEVCPEVREQQINLHLGIKRNKDLRRSGSNPFTVVHNTRLHATILQPEKFSRTMHDQQLSPSQRDLKKFAGVLHDALIQLRTEKEAQPGMVLGEVDLFGKNGNTLAVQPYGWRGYNKHYPEDSPNRLLADERILCLESIIEHFGCDDLEIDEVTSTPHISIAKKKGQIRKHELRGLRPVVSHALIEAVSFEPDYGVAVVVPGRGRGLVEAIPPASLSQAA